MRIVRSIAAALSRIGAGLAATHQGEYMQGWLPAMGQRPKRPTTTHRTDTRPAPAPAPATTPASRTEPPYLEQAGGMGAC